MELLLCLVLIISTVSGNVVPNDASGTTELPQAVERFNGVSQDTPKKSSKTVARNQTINFVPKDASEIIQFTPMDEIELGNQCRFDGMQGICTQMGQCKEYINKQASKIIKAKNDPCLNVPQSMIICCSNPSAPQRTRADSSNSEENFTDIIETI